MESGDMAIAICNPEIGLWYRDIENCLFEVVALEDDDAIEVQYADGNVAEYDRESWDMLCVNVVSDPGVGIDFYEEIIEEDILPEQMKAISWDSIVGDSDN